MKMPGLGALYPLFLLVFSTTVSSPFNAQQLAVSGTAPVTVGYEELTSDGAWCWFADPRAVYYESRRKQTYAGWVNRAGDIQIAAYDHATGKIEISTLREKLERDDHANPAVVYLSRQVNGVFEIEKWHTTDGGKTWRSTPLTAGSALDSVRPVAVRNHKPGQTPSVLWMQNFHYVHYTDYKTAIKMDVPYKPLAATLNPAEITRAMQQVADWQLAHPSPHKPLDWTHGALYAGMVEWAKFSANPKYINAMREVGETHGWALAERTYHADDNCVGQMYLELYEHYHDPKMIKPLRERFNYILEYPSPVTLRSGEQNKMDRWWWCDALFMAPPVWAKLAAVTGEKKYLEFMNKEFWASCGYLYDQDEHLFFRDDTYFSQHEANGKKVFWSRGNGWVFAGIARVLKALPADYHERPRYAKLFQEMAEKIASIQPPDGLWRPSLLDPGSYPEPETSGSGFYCYGLAWGINNKLLDRDKYLPAVQKAWAGLIRSIHPDGKLGWVQPIGAGPKKVSPDLTEIYGVGAFLLAGTEVYKISKTNE